MVIILRKIYPNMAMNHIWNTNFLINLLNLWLQIENQIQKSGNFTICIYYFIFKILLLLFSLLKIEILWNHFIFNFQFLFFSSERKADQQQQIVTLVCHDSVLPIKGLADISTFHNKMVPHIGPLGLCDLAPTSAPSIGNPLSICFRWTTIIL
jgi:hypothetical protein